MNDRERIAQLTTFSFFKDDPEIAAKIIAAPAPGTKAHSKARTLAKKLRASTRSLSAPPLDPFGRLIAACEQLLAALREIENPIDPNDPLLRLRSVASLLLQSMVRIEERVIAKDPGAEFDALARTVIYLPPRADYTSSTKCIGYKVEIASVEEARSKIFELAKSADGQDARTSVVSAFLHLLTTLLWPTRFHFSGDNAGKTLYFYFSDDPSTYRYLEDMSDTPGFSLSR
ncbi:MULTISPECIES: hypothetical protein [Sphingomonas]|uniref:hypothetical protein n=1 Tax=Sphingomonas TaxID=13687 RepID=UPI000DEFB471|nr:MULTISPECIES: hypothetical protein [Sphingomonas]